MIFSRILAEQMMVLVAVAARLAGCSSAVTETGWEVNVNHDSSCCAFKLKLGVLCVQGISRLNAVSLPSPAVLLDPV